MKLLANLKGTTLAATLSRLRERVDKMTKIFVFSFFILCAFQSLGLTNGTDRGGGDTLLARENYVNSLINTSLKNKLSIFLQNLDLNNIPEIPFEEGIAITLRQAIKEMMDDGKLAKDINDSIYVSVSNLKPEGRDGEAEMNVLGGNIYFDNSILRQRNVTESEVVGHAMHEHAHHFGFHDSKFILRNTIKEMYDKMELEQTLKSYIDKTQGDEAYQTTCNNINVLVRTGLLSREELDELLKTNHEGLTEKDVWNFMQSSQRYKKYYPDEWKPLVGKRFGPYKEMIKKRESAKQAADRAREKALKECQQFLNKNIVITSVVVGEPSFHPLFAKLYCTNGGVSVNNGVVSASSYIDVYVDNPR